MKKTVLFAAAAAMVMSACNSSSYKADLKNEVDTLSYALGVSYTDGLKEYLQMREGVDSTMMDEFFKGLNDGVNAGDDKKKQAYQVGYGIGQRISQQMVKGINNDLFGEDSTKTISLKNFMAGFKDGATFNENIMKMSEARETTDRIYEALRREKMQKQYGENKVAGEKYMAEVAKKEGIQTLGDGIYYEVLTEGKGEIPADTSKVKVHYEGKLIDGTVFDSSYKREEPTHFACNQVIKGWTKALTHMPVGSKWVIYIPQEQAYGEAERGQIKPFSALTFTVELLGIEK
ncbi:MAG: FKBP-type peptidyl-prolyl cis-trans isomerase [Paraprevotella sp.]|nr:FKBP-type peptidyl-prolyl cis-trans isomerase [Paraprevotella sp.]MBP3471784.1 FKBP-type peptidyl-prolyl cis-trans isomerase [Paraprevotella sp.]